MYSVFLDVANGETTSYDSLPLHSLPRCLCRLSSPAEQSLHRTSRRARPSAQSKALLATPIAIGTIASRGVDFSLLAFSPRAREKISRSSANRRLREPSLREPQTRMVTADAVLNNRFDRPNLKYEVIGKTKEPLKKLEQLLIDRFRNQCGIVYCLSKSECVEVSKFLNEKCKIKTVYYHAGLAAWQRIAP
ncbi:hypothetical protein VIGAN_04232800 [Vigna angularis var. angularis]|uniref:Helicase C-terminal domain-containing protein n=1 Tax=Vigna angularis var. angularis TaxID=157739 RepID=A0A0S3RWQ3_PHAAN|nr:hypothetical protein VIGAN_04232800 [Vigna angularis var. angularis]